MLVRWRVGCEVDAAAEMGREEDVEDAEEMVDDAEEEREEVVVELVPFVVRYKLTPSSSTTQ